MRARRNAARCAGDRRRRFVAWMRSLGQGDGWDTMGAVGDGLGQDPRWGSNAAPSAVRALGESRRRASQGERDMIVRGCGQKSLSV